MTPASSAATREKALVVKAKARPVRRQKRCGMWRRRAFFACAVLGIFGAFLVILVVQQNVEAREKTTHAVDYLLDDDKTMSMSEDPLGIASRNLELVGVSNDGMVVGYAAESDVAETMMELDRAMRERGWLALGMDTQGSSSYVWQGESEQVSKGGARTQGAYVLFICSARSTGSSVVAELL
ncbi:MAG: hypothetical protein LBL27_03000 [Coriobacteriales bacterium]|nr:hypothetical protein [Coriobacteriales bacterium]